MFPWVKLSLNFNLSLVVFLKAQFLAHYYLLFLVYYINDFSNRSVILDFHLFADDANLFYKHKNLKVLESTVNNELVNIHAWLSADKLSLNSDKSNFVIFHPPQRLPFHVTFSLNGINLNQEFSIKYLGIMIDSNLSWKSHVSHIVKKIKRILGFFLNFIITWI